jgi:peptidoglycan-N-acetylglucosamine deacetylase
MCHSFLVRLIELTQVYLRRIGVFRGLCRYLLLGGNVRLPASMIRDAKRMRRCLGEIVCTATRLFCLPAGKNPVWSGTKHGPERSRALSLTFDDGPNESTPRLLDVLERRGVRATFFQCGANIRRLPHIAREVHLRGHEIGNHTFTHSMPYWLPSDGIRQEIGLTQEAASELAGVVPTLFRAPFGSRWFQAAKIVRAADLSWVKWSHDSHDWRADEKIIAERATTGLHNGAILLFHDGRALAQNPDMSQTVRVIDEIIPRVEDQGYTLMPLSPLLAPVCASSC